MRYIRTKDGKLFDLEKIKDEIKKNNKGYYHGFRFKKLKPYGFCGGGLTLDYTAIGNYDLFYIKAGKKYDLSFALECDPEGYRESDDINELCDKIVVDRNDGSAPFLYDPTDGPIGISEGEEMFAAIWTDKGLIYVAKLNEKGKFELL